MKKIIITIILLICVSMNINSNVISISDRLNVENVANYINIEKDYNFAEDKEQLGLGKDSLIIESYDDFCRKMKICNKLQDKTMKKFVLYSSITEIMDNMHKNLNKHQYREFLMNFNILMYKHGFLEESSEYCDVLRK